MDAHYKRHLDKYAEEIAKRDQCHFFLYLLRTIL